MIWAAFGHNKEHHVIFKVVIQGCHILGWLISDATNRENRQINCGWVGSDATAHYNNYYDLWDTDAWVDYRTHPDLLTTYLNVIEILRVYVFFIHHTGYIGFIFHEKF